MTPAQASHLPASPFMPSCSCCVELIARWLLLYHGSLHVVRDHWPSLKAWADGAARVAAARGGDALPDFYVWGDWCAVEGRNESTPGTGPMRGLKKCSSFA